MAEGRHLPTSSPSSPLEDGEFAPQSNTVSKLAEAGQQAGPLSPHKPSYAAILQATEQSTQFMSIPQAQNQGQPSSVANFREPDSTILKPITFHQGKPAIHLLVSEKEALVEKLNLVLIGKFTHGRPLLSIIKIFFQNLKLQGDINISLADSKHIFIECSRLSDYYWIWLNLSLNINGFEMRIFKWGADFSPRIESPIAPVWIRIEGMPLYLFDVMTMWQISCAIGKPIQIDARNVNRSILSYARICVELDISQPLSDTIWVCIKDEKTESVVECICLKVFYDVLPPFCTVCAHVGHGEAMCKRKKTIGSIDDSKHKQNVETSQKELHKTVPVNADSGSVPAQVVTVLHHPKKTAWIPVKKHSTAAQLASENRSGCLNLQHGAASKTSDKAEIILSGEATVGTTRGLGAVHPLGSETEVDCAGKIDASTRNDEISSGHNTSMETTVAYAVDTKQSGQSKTAANQNNNNVENGHSLQNGMKDLATSSEHDWHLVTGKRNKNTNKTKSDASIPLHNLELFKDNLISKAKESVEVPTEQRTPRASCSVAVQSSIVLGQTQTLEQKCITTNVLQQKTEQTKRHIQHTQFVLDHSKANQEQLHEPNNDIDLNCKGKEIAPLVHTVEAGATMGYCSSAVFTNDAATDLSSDTVVISIGGRNCTSEQNKEEVTKEKVEGQIPELNMEKNQQDLKSASDDAEAQPAGRFTSIGDANKPKEHQKASGKEAVAALHSELLSSAIDLATEQVFAEPLITEIAVENNSNETRLQQDPSASGCVQKDGKNECTALVAWTAAAETDQATPPKLSWADQIELEQDQVTANSRSKNLYMPLEHTFELHSKREHGASGNFLCASIPEFYDLSPQEQKDEAAYIMAEFYQHFVRIAIEEEIERDSKTAAPEPEHLPTQQEWQTVTSKKKRTTKVTADQKGYQSRQMVDTRIESLCARINKMKRDCPAKRKLLAELEELNQLHFEDGA